MVLLATNILDHALGLLQFFDGEVVVLFELMEFLEDLVLGFVGLKRELDNWTALLELIEPHSE